MDWTSGITPGEASRLVLNSNLDDLDMYFSILPRDEARNAFLDWLHCEEKIGEERYCKQVCLLVYMASGFSQVPTALQLEAALAFYYRKDLLLLARTGFGKTLLPVIAHLLHDPDDVYLVLIISPLKRLQTSQAQSFYKQYGIFTLAINEDTMATFSDADWRACFPSNVCACSCRNYIVTPEQFVHDDGKHLPRFGTLIKEINAVRNLVEYVFVDEAHTGYTAGEEISGMPAFRPAWGQLHRLKLALPASAIWTAMTATLPPYMAQVLKDKILDADHRLNIRQPSTRHQTWEGLIDNSSTGGDFPLVISQSFIHFLPCTRICRNSGQHRRDQNLVAALMAMISAIGRPVHLVEWGPCTGPNTCPVKPRCKPELTGDAFYERRSRIGLHYKILHIATRPSHAWEVLRRDYADHAFVRTSSNRPNLVYATHTVVDSFDTMKNWDCLLVKPFDPRKQPRTLLFFDSIALEQRVHDYLVASLPEKHTRSVSLYHSDLSAVHLENTYKEFTRPNSNLRILLTTSGQSTGIDFPDVEIVCAIGCPSTITELLQRGGRPGRAPGSTGLFVTFFEPWIQEIEIEEFDTSYDANNPDRTRARLTDKSTKKDRATYSATRLAQLEDACIRQFYATEMGDESVDALTFINERGCCNTHVGDGHVNLSSLLPSPLYLGDTDDPEVTAQAKKTKNVYRKPSERTGLDKALVEWLMSVVKSQDPNINRGYIYPDDILSDAGRRTLVWANPETLNCPADIATKLQEKDYMWKLDWAAAIYKVIKKYDSLLLDDE
ncbi:hypothetical protein NMY22_g10996 [Coprinellus aureogranulatus]|nr:hypothetical protein NMY22_g10996 [Coprinellus aureogranulatus]